MRLSLLVALVLGLATVAPAALEVKVEQNADPMAGFNSYTIYFVAETEADIVTGFDGKIAADPDKLSQVWFMGVIDSIFLDDLGYLDATQQSLDTHLLHNSSQYVIPPETGGVIFAPEEHNDVSLQPVTGIVGHGLDTPGITNPAGQSFQAGFGLAIQSMNHDFAQVVLQAGETARLVGELGLRGAGQATKTPVDISIPEPATLGLLVIGAGVLLRRRRW